LVIPPGKKSSFLKRLRYRSPPSTKELFRAREEFLGGRRRKMAVISQKRVRESLIKQLEAKGAKVDCFLDLVESYMFYTKKEREMQKDINARGLSFEATSSTGKAYMKDNPSIKNAVMYNKQRLAILDKLGLTIEKVESGDTDDDDKL
jgi:hypothetical protein